MYTNSNICMIAFLCICLSACADHPSTAIPDGSESPVPIGFSSEIIPPSETIARGSVITDITQMYIYASYTGTSDWTPASHTFNYMYGQLVKKETSTGWTYSPVKYWPNNTADKISFFAYAPIEVKEQGKLTVSAASAANPLFTYTLPAKESEKTDLLAASVLNCMNTTQKVSFFMKHALTQVEIKVKNGATSAISKITLSAASITLPGTGSLSFNAATASDAFTWTPNPDAAKILTITADETVGGTGNNTVVLNADTNAKHLATFFLLPVGDPSSTVTLQLTYSLTKSPGTASGSTPVTMTTSVTLPATPLWIPGSTLVYTVGIIDDRLLIDDTVVIGEFGSGSTGLGDGDISAT